MRQEQHDLRRLAGVRERDDEVRVRNHPEVTVTGLGGVQEEGGRAGARKRRCDLAGNVPGFSHAGDDDPSLTGKAQTAGLGKARIEPVLQRLYGARLDRARAPRRGQKLRGVGCRGGRGMHAHNASANPGFKGARRAKTMKRAPCGRMAPHDSPASG